MPAGRAHHLIVGDGSNQHPTTPAARVLPDWWLAMAPAKPASVPCKAQSAGPPPPHYRRLPFLRQSPPQPGRTVEIGQLRSGQPQVLVALGRRTVSPVRLGNSRGRSLLRSHRRDRHRPMPVGGRQVESILSSPHIAWHTAARTTGFRDTVRSRHRPCLIQLNQVFVTMDGRRQVRIRHIADSPRVEFIKDGEVEAWAVIFRIELDCFLERGNGPGRSNPLPNRSPSALCSSVQPRLANAADKAERVRLPAWPPPALRCDSSFQQSTRQVQMMQGIRWRGGNQVAIDLQPSRICPAVSAFTPDWSKKIPT